MMILALGRAGAASVSHRCADSPGQVAASQQHVQRSDTGAGRGVQEPESSQHRSDMHDTLFVTVLPTRRCTSSCITARRHIDGRPAGRQAFFLSPPALASAFPAGTGCASVGAGAEWTHILRLVRAGGRRQRRHAPARSRTTRSPSLITRRHAICHTPTLTEPSEFPVSAPDLLSRAGAKRTLGREGQREPPAERAEPAGREEEDGAGAVPPPERELRAGGEHPECGLELEGVGGARGGEFAVCAGVSRAQAENERSGDEGRSTH
jgi:hypothetical protein